MTVVQFTPAFISVDAQFVPAFGYFKDIVDSLTLSDSITKEIGLSIADSLIL